MAGCSTQIEKGTSLLKGEKYEEAAEVFEKASGKSSMEREAYRGLGISYFELEQYDKAASAFETALEKGVKKTPRLYNSLRDLLYVRSDSMIKQRFLLRMEPDGWGRRST